VTVSVVCAWAEALLVTVTVMVLLPTARPIPVSLQEVPDSVAVLLVGEQLPHDQATLDTVAGETAEALPESVASGVVLVGYEPVPPDATVTGCPMLTLGGLAAGV
jgi:hypothetical protein